MGLHHDDFYEQFDFFFFKKKDDSFGWTLTIRLTYALLDTLFSFLCLFLVSSTL